MLSLPSPGASAAGGRRQLLGGRGSSARYPATIGAIEALEVIKVPTGAGRPLYDRLLQFDGAAMTLQKVEVSRAPDLPGVRRRAATSRELVDLVI